jgi:hypothetical protein
MTDDSQPHHSSDRILSEQQRTTKKVETHHPSSESEQREWNEERKLFSYPHLRPSIVHSVSDSNAEASIKLQ